MNRLIAIALVLVTHSTFAQEIKLSNLRCDYRVNPHGVGTATPRLSWELLSSHRGVMQSAYRILVSEDTPSLKKNVGTVWDSQKKDGCRFHRYGVCRSCTRSGSHLLLEGHGMGWAA